MGMTDYTSFYIPHLGEGNFDILVPVILTSVGMFLSSLKKDFDGSVSWVRNPGDHHVKAL